MIYCICACVAIAICAGKKIKHMATLQFVSTGGYQDTEASGNSDVANKVCAVLSSNPIHTWFCIQQRTWVTLIAHVLTTWMMRGLKLKCRFFSNYLITLAHQLSILCRLVGLLSLSCRPKEQRLISTTSFPCPSACFYGFILFRRNLTAIAACWPKNCASVVSCQ